MENAAFFTPSYIGDLDRVVWLRRSVNAFFKGNLRHVIAVPRKDLGAFRRAMPQEKDLELVVQEDFVAPFFYPNSLYRLAARIAPSQLWRLNKHAGRRGWIIQQIVKLGCPQIVPEQTLIFVDSDIFFIRPFDLNDLGVNSKRVLLRTVPDTESGKHRQHIIRSRELLGIPAGATEQSYMAYPAIWYNDWVGQLQHHIENISGKSWQAALFDVQTFSEYTLYGIYVEEVLKPVDLLISNHRFDVIAWDQGSYDSIIRDFPTGNRSASGPISMVIQSNLRIPPHEYEHILARMLSRAN